VKVLLLDTAGPVVGLAAWDRGVLVGAAEERIAAGTDGWLGPALDSLLKRLGGLDRVGVSVGPGAFTGLRVGVAAALGLGVATRAELVPLSALALRAAAVSGEPRVLALLDARKERAYAGWFDTLGPVPVALGEEVDLPPEQAVRGAPGIATGEGATVFTAALAAAGHRVAAGAAESPVTAGLALVREGSVVPAEGLRLRYLRAPDARPPGV